MKSYLIPSIFLVLAVIPIASCNPNENPVPDLPNETTRRIVSAKQIPEITASLLQEMGLSRNIGGKFSLNSNATVGFEIDWNKIKQLIDSTGKATYAFNINDTDNDPNTFYNLIFKVSEHGKPHKPFVLKYTMDEDFAANYQAGIEGFENFRGRIQRITISPPTNNLKGVANGPYSGPIIPGDPCPEDTEVKSKTQQSGPSNKNSNQNTTGLASGNWSCNPTVVTTDWYSCPDGYKHKSDCSFMETTIEIRFDCSSATSNSVYSDGDDPCAKKDETIPVLEPLVAKRKAEEDINRITDPEERRKAQLQYLKRFGEQEGKDFATLIESLLLVNGLTENDIKEINNMVQSATNVLINNYFKAIFGSVVGMAEPFIQLGLVNGVSHVLIQGLSALAKTKWGIDLFHSTKQLRRIPTNFISFKELSTSKKMVEFELGISGNAFKTELSISTSRTWEVTSNSSVFTLRNNNIIYTYRPFANSWNGGPTIDVHKYLSNGKKIQIAKYRLNGF